MAENSNIGWTDHTNNLWWGCSKVNAGCKNCYADAFSTKRLGENIWGEKKPRKKIKSAFPDLFKFQKQAAQAGIIAKVFIGSMMDIFEAPKNMVDHNGKPLLEDTGVLRNDLFNYIDKGFFPNLQFLFLTKRPENIELMIPEKWVSGLPPENVAFGVSVSTQEIAKRVLPIMAGIKGNKFISMEPMLEEIDLFESFLHNDLDYMLLGAVVDWVIVGGESGNKKRPFDADWARKIRWQCKDFGIPFFMKQMDKVEPIPEDLMVMEYPEFCKQKVITL